MKRILFLICTPYQILVSTKIIMENHSEDEVDFLLSDSIVNSEFLIQGLKRIEGLKNVKTIQYKKLLEPLSIGKYLIYSLEQKFKRDSCFSKISQINSYYDTIYYSSTNVRYNCVFVENEKYNINNHETRFHLFEDGFSSYTGYQQEIFNSNFKGLTIKDKIRKIYRFINTKYLFKTSEVHVFSPDLLEWEPSFDICEISKIKKTDTEYLSLINKVFDYKNIGDTYEQNVIFFEESYLADGIFIEDEEIIGMISEIMGKENMIVKIHPRNPINRFLKKGYITNHNTVIPWEVISQNIDLSEKILITIASGSALTTLVNMSIKPKKIIMLMNCEEIEDEKLTATLPMLRKLAKYYETDIFLPNNLKELSEYLVEIVEGERL